MSITSGHTNFNVKFSLQTILYTMYLYSQHVDCYIIIISINIFKVAYFQSSKMTLEYIWMYSY